MRKAFSLHFSLLLLVLLCAKAIALQWYSWHGQTHEDFLRKIQSYIAQDYIPVWLSGYSHGNKVRYAGIFRENPDNKIWRAYFNMTSTGLQRRNDEFTENGFMPIQVSSYTVSGSSRFAVLWVKDPTAPKWSFRWGMTPGELQNKLDNKTGAGYRVVSLSGYQYRGSARYSAIWAKVVGFPWVARYGMTRSSLDLYLRLKLGSGYLPKNIQGYAVGENTYYSVIMEKPTSTYPMVEEIDVSHTEFMDGFSDKSSAGYNLESINGYVKNDQIVYAVVWTKHAPGDRLEIVNVTQLPAVRHDGQLSNMLSQSDRSRINDLVQAFLEKWNIPGASVAIGKNEKLVYANGFGYANVDQKEKVNPEHLFRIASLSKPITSAATLKLIENHKLSLEDYAFGTNGTLNSGISINDLSNNERAIKIKHLLRHTSGGWPNDNDDPMFQMENLANAPFMKWTLDNQDVSSAPGTTYKYSNFGYFLLGRVIEKLTGKSYADYVKQDVFGDMGITNVHIAQSTQDEKRSDEVTYYRQGDPGLPYGMNVPRLDSCAGWIMTSRNILKFLAHVDKFSSVQDILAPNSLTKMSTGSGVNRNYGMGWGLENGGPNWNHLGSLPGASTFLKRIENGQRSFAIVMNARKKGDTYENALVQLMWDIVNSIEDWPEGIEF